MCAGSASAVNITTQHGDNGRTGLNASETILTPANVNQTTFGKLFEKSVDGDMYPQPLYLQAISIGGGTHNVVYCATANNSIYAFDADSGAVGAYWSRNLGTAVPQGDVDCCCTDVATVVGIMSTGVIDTSTNTWYVVHKQKNADATYHQFLHALDVTHQGRKSSSRTGRDQRLGKRSSADAKLNNQRCGYPPPGREYSTPGRHITDFAAATTAPVMKTYRNAATLAADRCFRGCGQRRWSAGRRHIRCRAVVFSVGGERLHLLHDRQRHLRRQYRRQQSRQEDRLALKLNNDVWFARITSRPSIRRV